MDLPVLPCKVLDDGKITPKPADREGAKVETDDKSVSILELFSPVDGARVTVAHPRRSTVPISVEIQSAISRASTSAPTMTITLQSGAVVLDRGGVSPC